MIEVNVRHPEVVVPLVGEDGNAFSCRVRREMQRAEVPRRRSRSSSRRPRPTITTTCSRR